VESRGRCSKDFYAEADKLSAEKIARRETGPRRQDCVADGGQFSERYRSISRASLSAEHQTRSISR